MKHSLLTLFALLFSIAGTAPIQAQPVSVSIPNLGKLDAGPVDIPIYLDEQVVENDDIRSFQFVIEYDSDILTITGLEGENTFTDGWTLSHETLSSGEFSGGGFGQSPVVGGPGTLVILEAEINPETSSGSPLILTDFRFNEGSPSTLAISGSVSTGDLPINKTLVINEIHVDPATNPDCTHLGLPPECGDANNDGGRHATEDEFVEIINAGSEPIPLDNYTLSDDQGVRYTFPSGTTLDPGVATVVFGGGSPTGIPGLVFTANGLLGLNNDNSDVVVLSDSEGNVVAAVTYSKRAIENESATRNPDFDGPFALHTEASPAGELYSPGRTLDGGELPVELNAFDAVRDGRDVVLRWSTASETNNSGFAVQQRVDGAFEEIGFVEGAGTTTTPQHYDYRVADLAPGRYAFRLTQVDADGTTTPSREVEVTVPVESAYVLESAYPNPFRSEATFTLRVRETQDVRVTLYNALGQRVQEVFAGTLQANAPETFTIDGARLPSGMYLYRVQGRTFSTSKQITRVK